jgi:proline iminopeptidase
LYYWANMEVYGLFSKLQQELNIPISQNTFESVRKSIYCDGPQNVDFDAISPSVRVYGLHDFIMGTPMHWMHKEGIIFYQSAHYPHMEENALFTQVANEFFCEII